MIINLGRERERHKVPYGAILLVQEDERISVGQKLAEWDPAVRPIITEYAGHVRVENAVEGVTVSDSR